jgi:hypothetical protein
MSKKPALRTAGRGLCCRSGLGHREGQFMKPLHAAILATVLVAVVIIGFYVLCGYVVRVTGSTTGLPAIGDAVARVIAALRGR